MERICLGVCCSALIALILPDIPDWRWLLPMLCLCFLTKQRFLTGATCYLLCLSGEWQNYLQQQQLLLLLPRQSFTGEVVSLPRCEQDFCNFVFQPDDVGASAQLFYRWHRQLTLQIRWPQAPVLPKQGHRYQLKLRLKAIRGLANPGAGMREAQALVQGHLAQGVVLEAKYLGGEQHWRQQVFDEMVQTIQHLPTAPLMLALSLGERPFTDSIWLGLQATGLGHLISISGMHIALVFGWLMLIKPLWQQLPVSVPARRALAFCAALFGATLYSALAGFAIPTLRAMVALMLAVLLKITWRRCSGRQFCLLITAALLVLQPFWLLSLSFWLSVLAVALVFLLQWRDPIPMGFQAQFLHFLRYQAWFSVLMLPLGLLFFHGVAPLALLSNLFFVPWCSVIAIPVLLLVFVLQLFLPWPLTWLWQCLDWIYLPLLYWLEWTAGSQSWWSIPQPTPWTSLLLLAAFLCALLPARKWAVFLCACGTFSLLLQLSKPLGSRIHLIDVGQGTSVFIQNGSHGLLYDLGPRYGSYSATRHQVIPSLRYHGIRHLDYVVVSHDDADHTGDAAVLRQAYPNARWVTDIAGLQPELNCAQLPRTWQGFTLQTLWPQTRSEDDTSPKNDQSCVILIKYGDWQILLTGDVGTTVEKQLLQQYPALQADLLLLGHHGSHSSSSLTFLEQISPQLALNSSGWKNHYRHPAQKVLQRLSLLQIPLFDTGALGAIDIKLTDTTMTIKTQRRQQQVKWLEKLSLDAVSVEKTR